MSTTIHGTRLNVTVGETSRRVTPPPAGRQFAEAVARGGQALVRAAIAVAQHVPGADVAAAALRGAGVGVGDGSLGAPVGGLNGTSGTASPAGSPASAPAGGSVGAPEGPSGGTNGAAAAAGIGNDGDVLTRGQEMSMRMLRLQESMSEENRRYTALSNVMHARHEMSKNAINNIR